MNVELSFAWLMLLLLGIFHGLNPGMGWLFAVGLGLQEQQRSAVWRALPPLALGHALAVAAAVLVMLLIGASIPTDVLKWAVAGTLLLFGTYRLFRHSHPRYGGMQMSGRDLTIWSFLMASAHGAGLMVLPFVFGPVGDRAADAGSMMHGADTHGAHAGGGQGMETIRDVAAQSIHTLASQAGGGHDAGSHAAHAAGILSQLPSEPMVGLLVTLVHTLGYVLIMGAAALIVYEKLGLRLLRTAWINLDLIWAVVLIGTAILTPFV